MQTPVRFYITQSDDQPVVRSVPVAVRPIEPEESDAPVVQEQTAPLKRRVPRIVPHPVRRGDSKR